MRYHKTVKENKEDNCPGDFESPGFRILMIYNIINVSRKKGIINQMKSTLIKDTTKEERIALIKAWIPDDDGLQDCDMDLWDIYADYINGKREIAEINAEMSGTFYTEDDLR